MPPTTAPLMQPFACAGAAANSVVPIIIAKPRRAFMRLLLCSQTWVSSDTASTRPLRQRFGADFGQRGHRRDGLRIDGKPNDGGLAAGLRLLERGREILGALHRNTKTAEGAGVSRKVRVAQLGRRNAAGIFALLMHADGAVHAVVDDDNGEWQSVLDGGRELLTVHQEIAVPRDAHHR